MSRLDHTEAIIEHLEQETMRPVGDGVAVKDFEDAESQDYPYSVVHEMRVTVTMTSGPFTGSQDDKILRYQVVSVGLSRRQAGMLAERVRDAMLSIPETLTIPEHRIQQVQVQLGEGDRETEIRPSLFSISDVFHVWSTPTNGD